MAKRKQQRKAQAKQPAVVPGRIWEAYGYLMNEKFQWTRRLDQEGFLVTHHADVNSPLVFVPMRDYLMETDEAIYKAKRKRAYRGALRIAKLLAREPRYIERHWRVTDCRAGAEHRDRVFEYLLAPLGRGPNCATRKCNPHLGKHIASTPAVPLWQTVFESSAALILDCVRTAKAEPLKLTPKFDMRICDELHDWKMHLVRNARRQESARLRVAAAYARARRPVKLFRLVRGNPIPLNPALIHRRGAGVDAVFALRGIVRKTGWSSNALLALHQLAWPESDSRPERKRKVRQ